MGLGKLLVWLGLKKKKASLLLVGLANSGKSSILHVLHTDTIDGVAPTVGFNVERLSVSRTKLKVYDMSGQSKYVALWEHYYAEAALLVFVVDAADGGSLAEARELLHRMLAHEALKGKPLLVYVNKMDVPTATPGQDVAARLQLDALPAGGRPLRLQPCSALRNEGVMDGIKWLLQQYK